MPLEDVAIEFLDELDTSVTVLSAKDVVRGDYLAQGRFGKVFKGRLKGLVDVAIKYQYISGVEDIKVNLCFGDITGGYDEGGRHDGSS